MSTALVQDEYALSGEDAMLVVSIGFSLCSILIVFVFLGAARVAKMYNERIVMLAGYGVMILGILSHYPFGDTLMPVADDNCTLADRESYTFSNYVFQPHSAVQTSNGETSFKLDFNYANKSCYGCPSIQTWCEGTKQIPPGQLVFAFTFTIVGSATLSVLTTATYSKILGPRPQGFWIGILAASTSLSRILGPVWLSIMYEKLGIFTVYLTLEIIVSFALVILVINFKNIAPMKWSNTKKGEENIAMDEV